MQTPKASHKEAPPRVSPRAVHQLKPTSLEVESASSSNHINRVPKDKSPSTVDHRSPRSTKPERKRPSRISELEVEISRLRVELTQARNQLSLSESWKKQAQQEAEISKEQLYTLTQKLKVSHKHLIELSASEKICITEHQKISQEQDRVWEPDPVDIKKQHSVDLTVLVSAIDQIQGLKFQLQVIITSENAQIKQAELTHSEIQSLKGNLAEALALVDKMKNQLEDVNQDAMVQGLANKTLLELESARRNIEALRLDSVKAVEAYKAIASELDQSRAHVSILEDLVSELQRDLRKYNSSTNLNGTFEHIADSEENTTEEPSQLKVGPCTFKSEVEKLRSALEEAEMKRHDLQIQSAVQIRIAHELVEQIKCESSAREAELEAMLEKTKASIEELKANLMDKETELQGISEENEGLKSKLEYSFCQKDSELQKELEKYKDNIADRDAKLMEKERELQKLLKENEVLKSEIIKREMDRGTATDEVVTAIEAARTAEHEAIMKLGIVMEEADKSNRRAGRVTEQLEAAHAANSEREAELRRLKVQSDQWRKAAEAAIAMLSADNDLYLEKTEPVDSNFGCGQGKFSSHYFGDMDNDLIKKKNGNKLKQFGSLWRKPQK